MASEPRRLDADYLDLAARAYTRRAGRPESGDAPRRRSGEPERVPPYLLIFDTETTTDRTQRLLFGCWRYVRVSGKGSDLCVETVEEGLFYPDDLGSWNPRGLEVIESFRSQPADVARHLDASRRLKVVTLREFLAGQLWRAGYELRAGVVCFNWPFSTLR